LFKQIAGLGNHDYPGTRHSVGMQFVNRLAKFLDMNFTKNRDCVGFVGAKELKHINLVLLKPKQPMNINGPSVYKTGKST
jgi:PTH1 family peptidyl-tRNA hydrolase